MAERTTELRHEIADTRERMTGTVDAIGDRVSPSRVAERRWASVRGSVTRTRHRVMGAPSSTSSSSSPSTASGDRSRLAEVGSSASDTASSAVSSVRDQVGHAPERVQEGTQGNPLAAGAIAFGLGVLVGSLAPATKEEADLAGQAMEPLQDQAKEIGQQVAETAKSDAQEAVEATKEAASDAATEVQEEARSGAQRVGDDAQRARREVSSDPS